MPHSIVRKSRYRDDILDLYDLLGIDPQATSTLEECFVEMIIRGYREGWDVVLTSWEPNGSTVVAPSCAGLLLQDKSKFPGSRVRVKRPSIPTQDKRGILQHVIVVPHAELATKRSFEVTSFLKSTPFTVAMFHDIMPMSTCEEQAIRLAPSVIVATSQRLSELTNEECLCINLRHIQHVFVEAPLNTLKGSFLEHVKIFASRVGIATNQTACFTFHDTTGEVFDNLIEVRATGLRQHPIEQVIDAARPDRIDNPLSVSMGSGGCKTPIANDEWWYDLPHDAEGENMALLRDIMVVGRQDGLDAAKQAICIFHTRDEVTAAYNVATRIASHPTKIAQYRGDMDKAEREYIEARLTSGSIQILFATAAIVGNLNYPDLQALVNFGHRNLGKIVACSQMVGSLEQKVTVWNYVRKPYTAKATLSAYMEQVHLDESGRIFLNGVQRHTGKRSPHEAGAANV